MRRIQKFTLTLILAMGLIGTVRAERPWQIDSQLVEEVQRLFQRHYVYSVPEERFAKVLDRESSQGKEIALRGLVETLGDPRVVLRSPDQEAALIPQCLFSSPAGIGVVLDGLVIKRVFSDHPAEEVGLRIGDRLISVDSQTVSTLEEARQHLITHSNTPAPVDLVVARGDTTLSFRQVPRRTFEIPYVESRIRNGVAYFKLFGFADSALDQWRDHLRRLPLEKTNGLIIDLRGTQSGYLTSVLGIASCHVGPGKIVVSYRGRDETKNYQTQGESLFRGLLVVLIDSETSGHAEILAACLREQASAILVGEPTAGDALVQQYFPLSDGSSLTLPVWVGYSPEGLPLDQGLIPDVTCAGTEVLETAESLLVSKQEAKHRTNSPRIDIHGPVSPQSQDREDFVQSESDGGQRQRKNSEACQD